jgi:predicted Fe-Mo cluster-binding NifX family protein
MKIAIPIWQSRVSPVFDVAGQFIVVDLEDGVETARTEVAALEEDPAERTSLLVGLGVETLICGAISKILEMMLLGSGVTVIPRVCGDAEEVLRAFCGGALDDDRYALPGWGRCQGGRRRRRARRCRKSQNAQLDSAKEELPRRNRARGRTG